MRYGDLKLEAWLDEWYHCERERDCVCVRVRDEERE